jgi:hypothetical protein
MPSSGSSAAWPKACNPPSYREVRTGVITFREGAHAKSRSEPNGKLGLRIRVDCGDWIDSGCGGPTAGSKPDDRP